MREPSEDMALRFTADAVDAAISAAIAEASRHWPAVKSDTGEGWWLDARTAARAALGAAAPAAGRMREPSEIAWSVVQRVAELPDRTSPDDWPEAMLVTSEELAQIVADECRAIAAPPKCWHCGEPLTTAHDHGYGPLQAGAAAPAAGPQPSEEAMAAYEQAAKWCEERAEKMRKWAKGMSDTESRQARYDHAEWVQGCADTIRHNAEKLRAAAPAQRQEGD